MGRNLLTLFFRPSPQSGSPMSVLSITVFGCARPSRLTSRASRHKNGCASFTKCAPLKSSTCNCPVRPAPSAHPAILRSTCRSAELSLPFTMRCLQVSCREAPRTVSRVPAFFTRTVVCAWHSIMAIAQMEKRIIRFIGIGVIVCNMEGLKKTDNNKALLFFIGFVRLF